VTSSEAGLVIVGLLTVGRLIAVGASAELDASDDLVL